MKGKLADVEERRHGSELTRDHALGETSLEVEDLTGLASPGGAVSVIYDEARILYDNYFYTVPGEVEAEGFDEIEIDDDPDPDAGTIDVVPPLARAYAEGAKVVQFPWVTERTAWVLLDDQEEEIPAVIDDALTERVDTGTVDVHESAASVEVESSGSEARVTNLVAEETRGLARGYVELETSQPIGSTSPGIPTVAAKIPIELPTRAHRLLFFASCDLYADDGVELHLGFDDGGVDFNPNEFPLAHFYGGGYDGVTVGGHNAFVGPAFVAPAIPIINLGNSGSITLPNGLFTGNVRSEYFPTLIAPYNREAPTPGLHIFRLTGYKVGAGVASVDTVRFWATVI